jgi:hypothetical protein
MPICKAAETVGRVPEGQSSAGAGEKAAIERGWPEADRRSYEETMTGTGERRRGLIAEVSMFVLGVLLEGGRHFPPGRAVELGDVIANGAGVGRGTLPGLPIRTPIAIL